MLKPKAGLGNKRGSRHVFVTRTRGSRHVTKTDVYAILDVSKLGDLMCCGRNLRLVRIEQKVLASLVGICSDCIQVFKFELSDETKLKPRAMINHGEREKKEKKLAPISHSFMVSYFFLCEYIY